MLGINFENLSGYFDRVTMVVPLQVGLRLVEELVKCLICGNMRGGLALA